MFIVVVVGRIRVVVFGVVVVVVVVVGVVVVVVGGVVVIVVFGVVVGTVVVLVGVCGGCGAGVCCCVSVCVGAGGVTCEFVANTFGEAVCLYYFVGDDRERVFRELFGVFCCVDDFPLDGVFCLIIQCSTCSYVVVFIDWLGEGVIRAVSYTHLTLPTNREV